MQSRYLVLTVRHHHVERHRWRVRQLWRAHQTLHSLRVTVLSELVTHVLKQHYF